MTSKPDDSIMMPFLSRHQFSDPGRKFNRMAAYPSGREKFNNFLLQYNSTIIPRNYGNRSGSLWEGNDLLQLGVLIHSTHFWALHPFDIVDPFMSESVSMLLEALDEEELQLPDAEILKRLKENGASESVAFYCGLASILRTPLPENLKTDYAVRWADRLRKRKAINYAESSGEATDPADPTFEYDEFGKIEEDAAHIIDEAETNDTAIAFIRMVLMAIQENEDTTNGKPFPAVKRSPSKYHKIPTTLGTYTCWTDGSIVVRTFSDSTVRSPKVVVISEVEVKRRHGIHILPQHISQLNAQMYRIALAYKQSNAAKDYNDIPKKDRTVYVICVNGKHFRACWVTYKKQWLTSLFGPFSQLGITTPMERNTMLNLQEFHVTQAYLLDTPLGREGAAEILIYIAFCVVRIGYEYDKVAHFPK